MKNIPKPLGISFIYLIAGFLWIFISDQLVFISAEDAAEILLLENLKGFLFVVLSSLLIYTLINAYFKNIQIKSAELDSFYNNPRVAILKTDANGKVFFFSKNFLSWLPNNRIIEGIHLNELIANKKYTIDFHKDLKLANHEVPLVINDNTIWVELTGSYAADHFILMLTRIDSKVNYEQALEKELRDKNALINNTIDLIWSIDDQMKLVSFNKPYNETMERATGKSIMPGMPVIIHEFGKELTEKWTGYYQRALNGEQFTVEEYSNFEGVETYGEISFNPIRHMDVVVGVACFSRDVTERKKAELALKEASQRLSNRNKFIDQVIKKLPIGIAVNDIKTGKAQLVNDKFYETYGWSEKHFDNVDEFIDKIYPINTELRPTKDRILKDLASLDPDRMKWRGIRVVTETGDIKMIDAQNIPFPEENIMISTVMETSDIYKAYQKIEHTIEGGKIGLWVLDLETGTTEINNYWAEMLGYRHEEVDANHHFFYDHLQPEDRKKLDAAYHKILDGKLNNFSLELRIKTKSGKYIWIKDNGQVIEHDMAGKPKKIAGIHLNITALKEANEQLARQTQRLFRAQEYGKMGNWSFNLKDESIYWSESMFEIYERDPNKGVPSFKEVTTKLYGEKQSLHNDAVQAAVAEGKPYDLELELTSFKGNKKIIRAIGIPLFDESGNTITGLEGIVQDVTERAKLTWKLEESEKRLEAAITGANLGVWDLNLKTGISFTNDRWWDMLGYAHEANKFSFEFFTSIVHPDDRPLLGQTISEIEKGDHNNIDLVLRLKHKDGNYRYIQDRGRAIAFDDQGKIMRMIGTHLDVTEIYQYQDQLKVAKEQIENIANNLPGAIFTYQLNLKSNEDKITFVSEGVVDLWEEKSDALKDDAHLIWSKILPEDEDGLKSAIRQSATSMKKLEHSWRIKLKNGKIKWVETFAQPKQINPDVVEWDAIIIDNTEKKQAEANLKASEEKYRILVERMTDAYVVFDQDWNYDYVNEKAAKLLGYSQESLIGANVWELFPEDIGSAFYNTLHQVKETGQSIRVEIYYEPYEVWYEDFIYPFGAGVSVFYHDITERKNSEIRLRQQEEYLNVMTNNASDAIVACDVEGKITFFNNTLRSWVGLEDIKLTPEEWPEKYKLYTITGNRLLRREELSLVMALEKGKVSNVSFMIKADYKNPRYVESNGSAMYNKSGEKIGAMVVIRDITERITADIAINNAVLEALEKERQHIAAELHDGLTQNLGIVTMNINNTMLDYSMLKGYRSMRKAMEYLELSIEQSRNLAHSLMPKSITDFGLVDTIEELAEDYNNREVFQTRVNSNTRKRYDSQIEMQLYRVIQEALKNVQKHAAASSCTINFLDEGTQLKVSVIDNGIGFDPENLPGPQKTGIGLRTMRNRILKLNGKFQIESSKEGTAVKLIIPLNEN